MTLRYLIFLLPVLVISCSSEPENEEVSFPTLPSIDEFEEEVSGEMFGSPDLVLVAPRHLIRAHIV